MLLFESAAECPPFEINVGEIHNQLDFSTYPFDCVLFIGPDKDNIVFGELWPRYGTSTYTSNDFDEAPADSTFSPIESAIVNL